MIKSLHIQNFQSHRDTVIELSPGMNVIVGDPQSGKTAILRSLNLLRTNRPSGFRYHSHFAKADETSVGIEVEEGAILFSKNESGASYLVTKGEQNQEFKKIGVSVPDMVGDILNLQDLNVQSQLDAPFLIGDNPADIAREINRVTKIDLIDKWSAELNRRKHGHSGMIQQMTRKAAELANKVTALDGIEAVEPILKECEITQRKSEQTKETWNSIRVAANELGAAESEIVSLEQSLLASPSLDKVVLVVEKSDKIKTIIEGLEQFIDLSDEVQVLEKSVLVIESFLIKATQKQIAITEIREEIGLWSSLEKAWADSATAQKEVDSIRKIYSDLVIKLGSCPFCFTPLDEKTMDHVLEHL